MLKVSQYIFILIVGMATLISTPEAKAFTYSQTDSSYVYPYPDSIPSHSGYLGQYLGNAISGVPTSLSLYFKGSGTFTPRIYICPDTQGVNYFDTNCNYIVANESMTLTGTKTLYNFTFSTTTFSLTGKKVYIMPSVYGPNTFYGSTATTSYSTGNCFSSTRTSHYLYNGLCPWSSYNMNNLYFTLTTNGDSPSIDPDNLQVQAAVPALDAIVATSTPFNFGFTTWVPTGQWTSYINDEKIRVRLALERWSDSVLLDFSTSSLPLNTRLFYMGGVGAGFSDNSTIYERYVTPQEGLYTYSTSTLGIGPLNGNFPTGDYRVRVTIELCPVKVFGICLGWVNARRLEAPFNSISLYNNFSAGYHSAVYEELTNVQNAISGVFLQPGTGTTTAYAQNYCNPLSGFDVSKCFAGLLVPSSDQFTKIFNDFQAGFLSRAPWGYFYIAGTILSGYNSVATSSLSASNLAITFPSTGIFATATSTSQFAGKTITIINFDTLIASTSASTGYQNVMASLTNFFNILFGIGFVYWLWSFSVRARL